jgi:cobalt-zinc-cadmium efflux system membrane fusion protein
LFETPSNVEEEKNNIIKCTGEVSVRPESMASIYAPVNGIVKRIYVLEGEKVKKGAPLFEVEHLDIIRLQEDYLKRLASYDLAKLDYDRKKLLFEKEAIAKKEFEQSRSEFESKKAELKSSEQQMKLLGISLSSLKEGNVSRSITVRAPIEGYMTQILVNNGHLAVADTPMATMVDDEHKHLHLKVFGKDVHRLKEDQLVKVHMAGSDSTYIAEIFLIGKQLDMNDRSVSVHAHLKEDAPDLIIGSFIYAEIEVE